MVAASIGSIWSLTLKPEQKDEAYKAFNSVAAMSHNTACDLYNLIKWLCLKLVEQEKTVPNSPQDPAAREKAAKQLAAMPLLPIDESFVTMLISIIDTIAKKNLRYERAAQHEAT